MSGLTDREIERIKIKFECLRRSAAYREDFDRQKKYLQKVAASRKGKLEPRTERGWQRWFDKETALMSELSNRWFHYPLLRPDISIDDYKKRLGARYSDWLFKTLGGLVHSDPNAINAIQVEVGQIAARYLRLIREGISQRYEIRTGKMTTSRLPADPDGRKAAAAKRFDDKALLEGLKKVRLTMNLVNYEDSQLVEAFKRMLAEMEPIRDRARQAKRDAARKLQNPGGSARPRRSNVDIDDIREWLRVWDLNHRGKKKREMARELAVRYRGQERTPDEAVEIARRVIHRQIKDAESFIEGGWRSF